jgi:hypothetical protein
LPAVTDEQSEKEKSDKNKDLGEDSVDVASVFHV